MPDMTMRDFIEQARMGGSMARIFTVSFVKRGDGTERVMTCRTGVKKGTKGGSLGYDPSEKHLLNVYDMTKHGYRMVNLDDLLTTKIAGRQYVWDRHKGIFVERAR